MVLTPRCLRSAQELPDDATAAEVELTVQGGDGGPNMIAELATNLVIDPMIATMEEHAGSLQALHRESSDLLHDNMAQAAEHSVA